ncbi:TPA: hypothetical protein ACTXXA_003735 [Legionella anisa]
MVKNLNLERFLIVRQADINYGKLSELLDTHLLRIDVFDLEQKRPKPGGTKKGFIAPSNAVEYLIKQGGGYGGDITPHFTPAHTEELSAIKETYGAACYGIMAGQSHIIDYVLIDIGKNDPKTPRLIVASKWIPNALPLTPDMLAHLSPQEKIQLAEILIISKKNIFDLDTKPENILVIQGIDGTKEFIRIDFGYAFQLSEYSSSGLASGDLVLLLKKDNKFTGIKDDFFSEKEVQQAQMNIRERVETHSRELDTLHQRFSPLLESYRELDPDDIGISSYIGQNAHKIASLVTESINTFSMPQHVPFQKEMDSKRPSVQEMIASYEANLMKMQANIKNKLKEVRKNTNEVNETPLGKP